MAWNFRLVRHIDRKARRVWYGVHEVFYNDSGKPWAMTQGPVQLDGESKKDLLAELEMVRRDIMRLPMLDGRRIKWAKPPFDLRHDRSKAFKDVKALIRDLRR